MPSPIEKGRAVSSVDLAIALWLLVAVGSSAGAGLARSALRDGRLGSGARLGLFAGELVASAVGLALFALCHAALTALRARLSDSRQAARAVHGVGVGLAWLTLFAYGVSWSLFWSVGTFLDAEAVRLAAVDSVMLVKHFIEMSPVLLALLPLASIGAVLGLGRGLGQLLGRMSPRGLRVLHLGAAGLLLAGVGASVSGALAAGGSGTLVRDPASGGLLTMAQLFRHARTFRTGPMSHLIGTAFESKAAPAVAKASAPKARRQIPLSPITEDCHPLMPMSEYVELAGKGDRRSVIVLLVESLRPDVLRSTGGSLDVMPELDRLAKESRRFVNAYAQASHSDYADLCPLSSHYPLRSRAHFYYPEHPTYPRVLVYDVLKALGYRTAIISSQNERWGNMYNYLDTGSLDLFFHAETFHDTFVDPEDDTFSKWAKEFGHSGKVDDRYTVDEAIRWIGESDKPFFVYINLQSSHFPYRVPENFPRRFEPSTVDFPYTFGNFPKDKLPIVENRYRNSLYYMDTQIGRLLDFLRTTHRMDKTVLIATGDNGEAFYEHGTSAHAGPVFEESVHVPLLVHAVGVKPGDDARLAQHIDVPATALGVLGLPRHPGFQGIDLLHAPVDPRRSGYLVVQTGVHQVALLRDGFKLITDYDYGRYSLYDLAHDPGETKDLSEADPARVESMAGRLHAWEKAQLEYYADLERQRRTYPPVMSDLDPP
jgi:arylsulfatase A-like enzyme